MFVSELRLRQDECLLHTLFRSVIIWYTIAYRFGILTLNAVRNEMILIIDENKFTLATNIVCLMLLIFLEHGQRSLGHIRKYPTLRNLI